MQKTVLLLLAFLLSSGGAYSNNVAMSTFTLADQNTGSQTVNVKFDIYWENSWRTSIAPNNWDAVWLFVKYKKASDGNWYHATLSTTSSDHSTGTVGAGGTIHARNDGKGVFFFRSTDGGGTFSSSNVKLQWQFGTDGVGNSLSSEISDFRVFAIEMVYVPEGSFYVGSGGSEYNNFKTFGGNTPYQITSEAQISLGSTAGSLTWTTGNDSGTPDAPIPAAFPKGFNAFYCMKYEITQEQYVYFLNTLTRFQQNTRTGTNLASGVTSVTNRYVLRNSSTMQYRNGIRCDASIHTSNPITFYCDFNGNGVPNEANDGQNIACNYLSWADGAAYSDWVALGPMTELEYEKACRGTLAPVANEYAWGNTTIASSAYTLSNAGATNEMIAINYSTTAGNCSYFTTKGSIDGPLRVGIFATTNSTRVSSGASYWGIMELSGNLWERPVTVGNSTGRSYTGGIGNGTLDASGDANVINWPGTDATGSGFRGGYWHSGGSYFRVSDRGGAVGTSSSRGNDKGFRCVSGVVL